MQSEEKKVFTTLKMSQKSHKNHRLQSNFPQSLFQIWDWQHRLWQESLIWNNCHLDIKHRNIVKPVKIVSNTQIFFSCWCLMSSYHTQSFSSSIYCCETCLRNSSLIPLIVPALFTKLLLLVQTFLWKDWCGQETSHNISSFMQQIQVFKVVQKPEKV